MIPKIFILHGLNNKKEAFIPIMESLQSHGYSYEILQLPGHGEDRVEALTFDKALELFSKRMDEMAQTHSPYCVVAFSQGALYLQLWLERQEKNRPLAQVLLAPALSIRHFGIFFSLSSLLPAKFFIPSQTPKFLRKFSSLYIWEYRILFQKLKAFKETCKPFKVPTLIVIDPQDEVVDAQKLKKEIRHKYENVQIEEMQRKYLKGRPGKHHILFHPDFFSDEDWSELIQKIDSFFKGKI